MVNYKNHIAAMPDVMFGKPCITGTRVTVELVLRKLAAGWAFDDLLDAYPRITKRDIEACLLFAIEN